MVESYFAVISKIIYSDILETFDSYLYYYFLNIVTFYGHLNANFDYSYASRRL